MSNEWENASSRGCKKVEKLDDKFIFQSQVTIRSFIETLIVRYFIMLLFIQVYT